MLVKAGHAWKGGFVMAHSGDDAAREKRALQPRQLTFACELDPARLAGLFADLAIVDDLTCLPGWPTAAAISGPGLYGSGLVGHAGRAAP